MARLWFNEDTHYKIDELLKVSNPIQVIKNAQTYFNDPNIKVFVSPVRDKKYSIVHPITNKLISFGSIKYQDFTKHLDQTRRNNYLRRATNIKGNWIDDIYSPNNLSINLLWH